MTFSENATYISLKQAAQKYGLSEKVLLDRIKSGRMVAVESKTGEMLVADNTTDTSLNIRRGDFEHLRGVPINASEASRKYQVERTAFGRWANAGFIAVIDRGRKLLLDEADVAYCAAVYRAKARIYGGQMAGVPIFDKEGNPYQPKYPELAAHKRMVRKRQRQKQRRNDTK